MLRIIPHYFLVVFGLTDEEKLKKARKKILAKAVIDSSGCWIWPNAKRHGMLMVDYEHDGAHRWAYRVFVGPIGDLHVCHRCDVSQCVNPDHLFLGSHADNMADMAAKDRGGTRELRNARGKLTDKQVVEIRRKHSRGFPAAWIASDYGVSASYVRDIVKSRVKSGRPTRHHAGT